MEEDSELKQRTLNKYLNDGYACVVGNISIDIAKSYCTACKIPFSPVFFHFFLPNDEKIKDTVEKL